MGVRVEEGVSGTVLVEVLEKVKPEVRLRDFEGVLEGEGEGEELFEGVRDGDTGWETAKGDIKKRTIITSLLAIDASHLKTPFCIEKKRVDLMNERLQGVLPPRQKKTKNSHTAMWHCASSGRQKLKLVCSHGVAPYSFF